MEALLSTAYLPPVEWMAAYAQADAVWLEAEEHYLKQTCRNRCILLNVSGSIELSVPVSKTLPNHCPVREMRISYAENWPRNHWRSIVTSYSTSPYFLYYRDYLEPFFLRRYDWLWDFNLEMLSVLLRLLRLALLFRLGIGAFFVAGGGGTAVGAPDVCFVAGMTLAAAFLVVLADGRRLAFRLFRGTGDGVFQVFDEVADGFGEMIEHGNKTRGDHPADRASR